MRVGSSSISQYSPFPQDYDPRAPTLTVAPGFRVRGSRLALVATYRLTSSLPASDRHAVLTLMALRSREAVGPPVGQAGDFELAGSHCLAALCIRLALGHPSTVARGLPSDGHEEPGDRARDTVCLELGYVRAVSSSEIEYYFRTSPVMPSADLAAFDPVGPPPGPAFFVSDLPVGDRGAATVWSVAKGEEAQVGRLRRLDLAHTRRELMRDIEDQVGGRSKSLQKDLLGLDEWRFRDGLRSAFTLAPPLRRC